MIDVIGTVGEREHDVAIRLRDIILMSWPFVERDQHSTIKIISGVQCHGQSPRDIDIVLIATFSNRATFQPFLTPYQGTVSRSIEKASVRDLCLVIELKDHDLSGLKCIGSQVSVRYGNGWSDATHQNERQKYSLKNYLEHHGLTAPYITNLLWLPNVLNSDLPSRPHNIIGGNSTWDLFLNVILQLRNPKVINGQYVIESSSKISAGIDQAIHLLTHRIEPSNLDRARMDRVCKAAIKSEWIDAVGKRQLTFHGAGGAGKTAILLRLAWELYDKQRGRVLLLTYNKALVADLRRLFTLLNLSDVGQQAVQIQTVHSFFRRLFIQLGFLDDHDDSFLDRYESLLDEAILYLKEGALTSEDLSATLSEDLRWEYVFVDEGQDWYNSERDLLREVVAAKRIVIADGGNQLVRRTELCRWNDGTSSADQEIITLPKCLRMKAGLARFVRSLAREIGVEWSAEQNLDAPGGRVIIVEGDYFLNPELHHELISEARQAGNSEVDILFCIPSSLAVPADPSQEISLAAQKIVELGNDVWDGVDTGVRSGYPTELSQLRLVQYESCRGLEGWTVIALGLDEFYTRKLAAGNAIEPPDLIDIEQFAARYAARWLLIPLTRGIDTLVIQLSHTNSPLKEALKKASRYCSDTVIWKKIE